MNLKRKLSKEKINRFIWGKIVSRIRKKRFYPMIYRSYWHSRFYKSSDSSQHINFFSAVPNRGAGIGHQMANWIAGYWFANQMNLKFAHIPFSSGKWESFLGFGEDEIKVYELINNGFKKVKLPLFDENNSNELLLTKKIIDSYQHKKVVFIAEQDQFYYDQFGVMDEIKKKFRRAKAREKDKLEFSKEYFNIAIHVRRGDIVIGQENKNPNLMMRWQDNTYFEKVLTATLDELKIDKPIRIYLFSQGEQKDFYDFEKYENLTFCLDMSAQDSFLHMVYADLLITSKSSFSYKPALLSDGIKVCPESFWHGYPSSNHWILAKDDGSFSKESFQKLKLFSNSYKNKVL